MKQEHERVVSRKLHESYNQDTLLRTFIKWTVGEATIKDYGEKHKIDGILVSDGFLNVFFSCFKKN